MDAIEFLKMIPHRTVDIGKERVELFRLGMFENESTWELVGFTPGVYRPHIHDTTRSTLRFIFGKGSALVGEGRIPYAAGDCIRVKAGEKHGFEVQETTLILSIQDRAILDEPSGRMDFRFAD